MANVIDLFAGVGGLSLGAARAGFDVRTAVELDQIALRTHSLNFPKTTHFDHDASTLSGARLLEEAHLRPGELHGLIGGPPCQGFSSIGRQQINDDRNNLFYHFFRLVSETTPQFFLAENVPGIMASKHSGLRSASFNLVKHRYLVLDPIKVVASDYGAATRRTRIFFIGVDRLALSRQWDPRPEDFLPSGDITATNVRKALTGLPRQIRADWGTDSLGWRKVKEDDIVKDDPFFNRITAMIPRDVGHRLSIEKYQRDNLVSGCMGTRHSEEVIRRFKKVKAGSIEPVSRFPRLDPEGLCPTLRAGTASDRGSYQAVRPIHYRHNRVITPREAARLQGFPDWFRFHETKWHSFRQIGNSVSPIVAEAMLSTIYDALYLGQRTKVGESEVAEVAA